jgi:hypothetical protein
MAAKIKVVRTVFYRWMVQHTRLQAPLYSLNKKEKRGCFPILCSSGAGKIQTKEKQLPAEKPMSHTTDTYTDFWDWKGDRNYVHYDHCSSNQGGADHRDYLWPTYKQKV